MARTHGTISCYQRGGCRCSDCTRAARIQRRRYRTRTKKYTPEVCRGCGQEFVMLGNHRCEWAA